MQLTSTLCDTCKALVSGVVSGEFCVPWQPAYKSAKSLAHHTKEYFQHLQRPCCSLCEVMKHSMWSRTSPNPLAWKENWRLHVYFEPDDHYQEPSPLICPPWTDSRIQTSVDDPRIVLIGATGEEEVSERTSWRAIYPP